MPLTSPLVLTKPPYEVSETGWGEFEVVIKIFFVDTAEKPVSPTVSFPDHWTETETQCYRNVNYWYRKDNDLGFEILASLYGLLQLTIYHLLKLFQNDPAVIAGKRNVVSEHYDEMVHCSYKNTC